MKEKQPTVAARIPQEVHQWILARAAKKGVKPSEIIRQILAEAVARG